MNVGFPESRLFKIRVKLEIINFTQWIFILTQKADHSRLLVFNS